MKNSSAKQSGKDGGQQGRQPPIRIDEREQGQARKQSGRGQHGDSQQSSGQQNAQIPDNQQGRHQQGGRQQGDDSQSSQQGRNLPEGNQQDRKQNPSQQPQGSAARKLGGQWQQQVGNAKVMWGKLTDDELLKTEGHADKLEGLVRERYGLSQEAARAQVKKFLADSGY